MQGGTSIQESSAVIYNKHNPNDKGYLRKAAMSQCSNIPKKKAKEGDKKLFR